MPDRTPIPSLPWALALVGLSSVGGALLAPVSVTSAAAPERLESSGSTGFRGFVVKVATGSAGHFDSPGGRGIFSQSKNLYGIWARSDKSWGGLFESVGGYGVVVRSLGNDHWDHAGVFEAQDGWGVYAKSEANQALRGEAGNITGFPKPLGAVGVVGIGTGRGAYGSSGNGSGVYGSSANNYGMWGQSENWRGITGRTDLASNNYGIYTPDNLFASGYDSLSAFSQIMENGGTEPLEPGDVVVLVGIGPPLEEGKASVVRVARAGSVSSRAVIGVVESRYNEKTLLESFDSELETALRDAARRGDEDSVAALLDEARPTLDGEAAPGDFVRVVVRGAVKVKAAAFGGGAIRPGDGLAIDATTGLAQRASSADDSPSRESRLGTALENLTSGEDKIYTYVEGG